MLAWGAAGILKPYEHEQEAGRTHTGAIPRIANVRRIAGAAKQRSNPGIEH